MRKVGKATAVALLTPMTAAAIAALSTPARAAGPCPILSLPQATITPPTGTITAGSTVHVQATICGMLAAHLQISGPGIDQQVGRSTGSGMVGGDVTVPKPGHFTLTVVGDITKHTYATDGFSAQPRPVAAAPSLKTPSRSPSPTRAGNGGTSPFRVPSGTGGAGGADSAGGIGSLRPLNQSSPFSLPSVTPDGAGVQYPTPDPEVAAAPTAQPQARDAAATTPVSWGRSIAVAIVLLLLSAHFGMWSRRQRLAAEGARGRDGGPAGTGVKGARGRRNRQKRGTWAIAPGEIAGADVAGIVATGEPGMTPATASSALRAPATADPAMTASADDRIRRDERPSSSRRGYRGRRRRD